jgi:hypothetical protein
MYPVLKYLEPFALDLVGREIYDYFPSGVSYTKETFFGGLYQKVVVTKD